MPILEWKNIFSFFNLQVIFKYILIYCICLFRRTELLCMYWYVLLKERNDQSLWVRAHECWCAWWRRREVGIPALSVSFCLLSSAPSVEPRLSHENYIRHFLSRVSMVPNDLSWISSQCCVSEQVNRRQATIMTGR